MEFILCFSQNQELEALRKSLADAETRLAEKDDAAMKMIDQMEELHENLAELDARFERYVQPASKKKEMYKELVKSMAANHDITVIVVSLL